MINLTEQKGITIISFSITSISGVTGVEEVSQQIRSFIAEKQPPRVVIDFSDVRFLSSQMLGVLVDTWRRLGEYGGSLMVSGINPQISRVFKITNLDRIFDFYPDVNSAIDSVMTD